MKLLSSSRASVCMHSTDSVKNTAWGKSPRMKVMKSTQFRSRAWRVAPSEQS